MSYTTIRMPTMGLDTLRASSPLGKLHEYLSFIGVKPQVLAATQAFCLMPQLRGQDTPYASTEITVGIHCCNNMKQGNCWIMLLQ
jgi:hypothetical protein